jgi:hypothetical protein
MLMRNIQVNDGRESEFEAILVIEPLQLLTRARMLVALASCRLSVLLSCLYCFHVD